MSEVAICNTALQELGADRISALTDPTPEAEQCNLLYAKCRDWVLRLHEWNFATKYEALAVVSGATVYGYTYAYGYPTDCLKARGFHRATPTADPIRHRIVSKATLDGKEVWTDEEDAVLIYTARVTDTNVFDTAFETALAHYLALKLLPSLIKDDRLRQVLAVAQERYMLAAITVDADEGFENDEPKSNDIFNEARV